MAEVTAMHVTAEMQAACEFIQVFPKLSIALQKVLFQH